MKEKVKEVLDRIRKGDIDNGNILNEMFNLHNKIHPTDKQFRKHCGSCQKLVLMRLREYLRNPSNI